MTKTTDEDARAFYIEALEEEERVEKGLPAINPEPASTGAKPGDQPQPSSPTAAISNAKKSRDQPS